MPESYDKEFVRLMIVATAAQQAAQGAHYINGADGGITGMNTPGEAGGGLSQKRKILHVEDHSWEKLAVHAAMYGKSVCRGRYEAVGGYAFVNEVGLTEAQLAKIKLDKSPAGKFAKLKDEYVKELETTPVGMEKDFDDTGLYPRRGRGIVGDTIYLGEDCRDKRHFDCISFVNWVLTTVLQRLIWYQEADYFSGKKLGAKSLSATTTSFMNGDIAVRIHNGHEHIGFLTADGKMIHARYPEAGVQVTGFLMDKDKDTKICRLSDSFLRIGA
jgi:hypothetical protein